MLNFSNASTRPARQTTRCSFTSSSPPRPSRISYFTDAEPDARKSGEDVETVYLRVRAGFPPIGNAAAARHLPFRKGEEKTCRVKRYHRCLFVLIHSRPPPILLPPPPLPIRLPRRSRSESLISRGIPIPAGWFAFFRQRRKEKGSGGGGGVWKHKRQSCNLPFGDSVCERG